MNHDHDEHREGLEHDLPAMQQRGMVRRATANPMARRGVLGLFGGVGAVALVGCGSNGSTTISSTDSSGAGSGARPSGAPPGGGPGGGPGGAPPSGAPGGGGGMDVSQEGVDDGDIPEETNGPFPADGTNGTNVLTESGIVRSEITTSFGDASGVAEGVPLTVDLVVSNHTTSGTTPYAGAAVYIWHCDRDGNYSLYADGIENENYLRGVQEVAADGTVTFQTIYPACYSGRWPHIHFEVYPSLDDATSASNKLRTSQIAFPQDVCETVYGSADGYDASVANLARVSLDSDNVFSDGHSLQMATLEGSVESGYTLSLAVPV